MCVGGGSVGAAGNVGASVYEGKRARMCGSNGRKTRCENLYREANVFS